MSEYTYLETLDAEKLKLYSLQLINVERIKANDIIYIFDEVGGGKTVSSGLCIRYMAFQQPRANILVVTAPSVVEQFHNKLTELLDLQVGERVENGALNYSITISNYDYRNLAKQQHQHWDLVVIDEAHEFLNPGTKRFEALSRLSAGKIIFMTATPIKQSLKDLDTYPLLGAYLLSKRNGKFEELKVKWTKKLRFDLQKKRALCEGFHPASCVTRYFKETIRNIEKVEGRADYQDNPPKRLVPELWKYDIDKNKYLSEKIDAFGPDDRFVIFVNRKHHIDRIKGALAEKGFEAFDESKAAEKTFCSITGDHDNRSGLLNRFSDPKRERLPKVLIMTYQIAEQGIDLPAYNYIINYHIPSSPSRLEQRFGRIDRLNSIHNELHTCFLISRSFETDSNNTNFYAAVATYLNEFLPLFPSKNCLITDEIIQLYSENVDRIIRYYEQMTQKREVELFEAYSAMNTMWLEYESLPLFAQDKLQNKNIYKYFISRDMDEEIHPIVYFMIDRELDLEDTFEEFKKTFLAEAEKQLKTTQNSKQKLTWWKEHLEELSDQVFYIEDEQIDWVKQYPIEKIDPKEAAQNIVNDEQYRRFSERIMQPIHVMRLWNTYKMVFEQFFETIFHELTHDNGWFDLLIDDKDHFAVMDGLYRSGLREGIKLVFPTLASILHRVPQDAFDMIKARFDFYIPKLPFFKMRNEFKKIVHRLAFTQQGYYRTRYDFEPIADTFCCISISKQARDMSPDFFERYMQKPFCIQVVDNKLLASNWLKLLYVYANKKESERYGLVWRDADSLFGVFRYTNSGNRRRYTDDLGYDWGIRSKQLQPYDDMTKQILSEL